MFFAACAQASTPFVSIPDTVSKEGAEFLRTYDNPADRPPWPAGDDIAGWEREWRAGEKRSEPFVTEVLARYQPSVEERKLGGVRVLDIKPKGWKDDGKLLVYTHGGAHTFFSAHSTLPISVLTADATQMRVLSIDYTVAPAGKWQQVTDEVLAVFADLQSQGHKLKDIAIYGDSAGGALAASSVLKMRDKGLGMPAAVILWAPWADITNSGDTAVTLKDADPAYLYEKHLKNAAAAYAAPEDQKNPYVSPVYGDYSKGFPPTLIQGGTKEIFLSHFVRLYRAIDGTGGVAVLDLYEGMTHVFQPRMGDAPEGKAAMKKMAAFLKEHLKS